MKQYLIVSDTLKETDLCFKQTYSTLRKIINRAVGVNRIIFIGDNQLRFVSREHFEHCMRRWFKGELFTGPFWLDVLEKHKDKPEELFKYAEKTDSQ